MKRVVVAIALAAAASLGGSSASADSYCFQSGLRIFGQPWFSHQVCLPCPVQDCPSGRGPSDGTIEIDEDAPPAIPGLG